MTPNGTSLRGYSIHFLVFLVIFGAVYFLCVLPLFQVLSQRARGRRFVIRLGTPWQFSDPAHRWDVLLSFLSFMMALGVSLFVLDWLFPLAQAG